MITTKITIKAFTMDKDVIRKTNIAGKIPLIIDLDGEKNQLIDWFEKLHMKKEVIMAKVTFYFKRHGNPEFVLRSGYVQGCKFGQPVIYNVDDGFPEKWSSWVSTNDHHFNQDVIFDLKKNNKREYLAKIIKPGEDESEESRLRPKSWWESNPTTTTESRGYLNLPTTVHHDLWWFQFAKKTYPVIPLEGFATAILATMYEPEFSQEKLDKILKDAKAKLPDFEERFEVILVGA